LPVSIKIRHAHVLRAQANSEFVEYLSVRPAPSLPRRSQKSQFQREDHRRYEASEDPSYRAGSRSRAVHLQSTEASSTSIPEAQVEVLDLRRDRADAVSVQEWTRAPRASLGEACRDAILVAGLLTLGAEKNSPRKPLLPPPPGSPNNTGSTPPPLWSP